MRSTVNSFEILNKYGLECGWFAFILSLDYAQAVCLLTTLGLNGTRAHLAGSDEHTPALMVGRFILITLNIISLNKILEQNVYSTLAGLGAVDTTLRLVHLVSKWPIAKAKS